jgi:hypothetical protein
MSDVFAAFTIRGGSSGLDYDVDCTPWLTGTAVMAGFELEQAAGDPVVYAAPVSLLDGGRVAKFVAAAPDGTTPGPYLVRVKLTDTQGRVDRQWFQMTVEQ